MSRRGTSASRPTVRLLPVVAIAALTLIGLKSLWLVVGDHDPLPTIATAAAQDAADAAVAEIGMPDPDADPADAFEEVAAEADGRDPPEDDLQDAGLYPSVVTPDELDVLQSLAERRKALDERERQLALRENLLKAATKRLEERIAELKGIEERIEAAFARQEDAQEARLAGLVTLYEKMRPRDAARIFSRLDTDVLIGIAERMNPRTIAPIVAQMDVAAAERLTMELAARTAGPSAAIETLPSVREIE